MLLKPPLPAPQLKPVLNFRVVYQIFATAKTLQKTVYRERRELVW